MSWLSGHVILDSKSQKHLIYAEAKISSSVRHSSDLEEFPNMGENISPVKELCSDKIFESFDEAKKYCFENRKEWERRFSPLVAYKDIDSAKDTNKIISLRKRIEKEREKLSQYDDSHNVSDFKANFIGCPHCKSKINKEFLRNNSNKCPVCWQDMRSNTTLNTLERYNNNIKKMENDIVVEQKKQIEKLPIKYLVYYEEYVG